MKRTRPSTDGGAGNNGNGSAAARVSGSTAVAGPLAAATWLRAIGGSPPPTMTRWHVGIFLDVVERPAPTAWDDSVDTRFHIDIFSEEWGLFFCHQGKSSWIRVTDIAFVHGRDDYRLLDWTPPLAQIGAMVRSLEQVHTIKFQRRFAAIETEMTRYEPQIRAWIENL